MGEDEEHLCEGFEVDVLGLDGLGDVAGVCFGASLHEGGLLDMDGDAIESVRANEGLHLGVLLGRKLDVEGGAILGGQSKLCVASRWRLCCELGTILLGDEGRDDKCL